MSLIGPNLAASHWKHCGAEVGCGAGFHPAADFQSARAPTLSTKVCGTSCPAQSDGRGFWWRTHSCVPCRHSCRHSTFLRSRGSDTSSGRSPAGTSRAPQTFAMPSRMVVILVAHALLRAVSALLPTLNIFAIQRQRHERESIPGGNVSGATNLLPCPVGWSWILVAHALLRAVSALLPTLNIFAIQRQRNECRCGTQECVRHFSPPVFPAACAKVCGEWRRGPHERWDPGSPGKDRNENRASTVCFRGCVRHQHPREVVAPRRSRHASQVEAGLHSRDTIYFSTAPLSADASLSSATRAASGTTRQLLSGAVGKLFFAV